MNTRLNEKNMVLTNFMFLNGVVGAVTVIGAFIVLYPIDSSEKLMTILGLVFAMSALSVAFSKVFLKNKESIWFQPVSKFTVEIITNIVVACWLCVIATTVFLLAHTRSIGTTIFAFALLLIVGLGCGWWLRLRFWKYSLLPYGIGFTIALVALTVVWCALDGVPPFSTFCQMLLGAGAFIVVISGTLRVETSDNENRSWLRDVSTRVGWVLMNCFVFLCLCVVGLIVFFMLKDQESTRVVIVVITSLIAGAAFGRYLQKRFWSNSLVPYGISFFCSLVVILIIFGIMKLSGIPLR